MGIADTISDKSSYDINWEGVFNDNIECGVFNYLRKVTIEGSAQYWTGAL